MCPVVLKRKREDGDPMPGADDDMHVMEGHAYFSSVDKCKDPDRHMFFVSDIDANLNARNVDLNVVVLDVDNCPSQFKNGRAVKAIKLVGDKMKADVLQMSNTPCHGKNYSDSFGGITKT